MKLQTYLPTVLLAVLIVFTACDNEPLEGEFVVDDAVETTDDTTDPTDDTTDPTDDPTDPTPPTGKRVSQEMAAADRFNNYTYAEGLLVNWSAQTPSTTYNLDFVYDASNRVIEWDFSEPGFERTTTFTYNGDGSLSGYDEVVITYDGSVVTASGTISGDPDALAIMQINGSGLVTRCTTQDGDYAEYTYDANGNMTSATGYEADGTVLDVYTMTYDSNVNPYKGQLTSIYYERFLEFFYPFDGVFIGSYEGYSFPYTENNLTNITREGGLSAIYTYTYDDENYPTSVSEDVDGDIFSWTISYE